MENKISRFGKGISLRTLYFWLILIAGIISAIMIYSTFHLFRSFNQMKESLNEYISLDQAAHDLMDASDYLTEKVQRFTVDGKKEYMNQYFAEAFETKRREAAINKLSEDPDSAAALEQLQQAMDASLQLMNQEYYAMRLVVEAKDYKDYPVILEDVELSEEDAALSPDEKMRRATELVLGEEYYAQKDVIRLNMKESLDELSALTETTEKMSVKQLSSELNIMRVVIIIQTLGILLLVWLTSVLGINPVLKAVERIKDDSPIPEVGANEFRYLARTYNKMYNVYKKSVEHLNYKASHDELTGVYNRAGYDLLVSSIDLESTYLILFDVDDFKKVNDTYGHEMGDKILIKVANVLKSSFRSDDYVCRLGGDEFVVFMVHSEQVKEKLIRTKMSLINAELQDTEDGLPPISVSAGITHGAQASSPHDLFEKTDKAMYESKRHGKHTITFYS